MYLSNDFGATFVLLNSILPEYTEDLGVYRVVISQDTKHVMVLATSDNVMWTSNTDNIMQWRKLALPGRFSDIQVHPTEAKWVAASALSPNCFEWPIVSCSRDVCRTLASKLAHYLVALLR